MNFGAGDIVEVERPGVGSATTTCCMVPPGLWLPGNRAGVKRPRGPGRRAVHGVGIPGLRSAADGRSHGWALPRSLMVARSLTRPAGISRRKLDRIDITDYACNWKTFMEVYLEVYHVDFLHAGLGNFTDIGNFRFEHGERTSVQVVSAKNSLATPGTPVYRRWQEACLAQLEGRTPKYGALWAAYYPGLTFEWYPNVLVVSNLIPRTPQLTTNVVEFYYPAEIVDFEREFVAAQQAAYAETAREDDEICLRMDRGRRALWRQGLDDAGPYQSPMEDATVHFHEWLRRELRR